MDVFRLDDDLLGQYISFARSFTRIRSVELQAKVDALYAGRKFWPEPLIQLNPHYEGGGSVQSLVGPRGLTPRCTEIFRDPKACADDPDKTLKLRRHQEQAIGLALDGKSFVVTTGTGSGKSLCFFIPIIDAILKAKAAGEGASTRAVIVYPMNALANSQLEELKKFLGNGNPAVTYARYTGQESSDERERIKNNPPDILLTNFMMLELLMTRQSELDRQVIENCRGLRFVVLDELHTYRGRQGADVAMLMRRVRARVGDPAHPPICVGTSATMSSEGEEDRRNEVVAVVASRLFGTKIERDAVVTETLRRATDPERSADRGLPDLGDAVDRAAEGHAYDRKSNAEIAQDALAVWVETRLGLKNVDRKPERANPRSIEEASKALAEECGRDPHRCAEALKAALLAFSQPEDLRGVFSGSDEPLFAFKLHQFISGAGRLYTTLDHAGHRTATFDGQIFDPTDPTKRLYATHFCRRCGQEHHPVTLRDDDGTLRFEKREIDDVPVADDQDGDEAAARWGFLMPEPVDGDRITFQGRDEDYPDLWLEQTKSGEYRLKPAYRKTRAELFSVLPDGTQSVSGQRAWFMPGRFKFCPACGEYHSDSTRDINRLASLSAEGRSSATTIIIAAILRWMNDPDAKISKTTRKLLAFTDNRQDAALQAGHFNDFVFVALLRGAILAALEEAGEAGLQEDQIGQILQRILGFVGANNARRLEWLIEPDLRGANLINAERAMRETLGHRFWIDQRRGWRFTNPNLEQLGLIEARYVSQDELVQDDAEFDAAPLLRKASPAERAEALRAVLDVMRRGLAVESDALDRLKIESLASRSRYLIKSPWSLDEERFLAATVFMPQPPTRREVLAKDEDLIVRGSPNSLAGRELRKLTFGGERAKGSEITTIIETLLRAAGRYGLVTQVAAPVEGEGWRLLSSSVVFDRGKGDGSGQGENPFFRSLYQEIGRLLAEGGEALFGFESREHTAQVESDLRELREARFRSGEEDRKWLAEQKERLRELREDDRPLPTLFCSPTMELGVDISAMNVVYMRNVPPTPANYAQRSGRAGRSGQAALIVTYCAAQSPHDQYFFQQPRAMVHGIVLPPSIDLANPELVQSHLQAEWLAASGADLSSSIAQNLDMSAPDKPLLPQHWDRVSSHETRERARERVERVLSALSEDYAEGAPDWFTGVQSVAREAVDEAPQRFAGAFDRWRDLLAAAERQRDDATRTLKDYSISQPERRAAEIRQSAANLQIKLLLSASEKQGSDFYVYRYLATEGFLPGYNFPRLPLMAFVPGGRDGSGQRYIQRARFLAISEFGPGSLIYHEGRAYRVDRALLKEAGGGPDGMLPTFATAICPMCGAGHDGEPPERCHVCWHPLGGSNITDKLHRIENVGTRQVERITANDEERRRQGYDLQTTFSFRRASGRISRIVTDARGEILAADFAPAALVRRINRGLRRRRDESNVGFMIDPRSGYWAGTTDSQNGDGDSPTKIRQRILPVVEDHKNALLIRFPLAWRVEAGADVEAVIATVQHALARGIEAVYQLEEGEILAEPTPTRKDRHALLFYEAAEGGAGALSRLVREEWGFRDVAREALTIMHYDPASFEAAAARGPDSLVNLGEGVCVAACYRCLLSYYNQPDHELIDRRHQLAQQMLLRLAFSEGHEAAYEAGAASGLDGCPPPDPEPMDVDGFRIDLIWRSARIAAAEQDAAPAGLDAKLAAKGIDLVLLPAEGEARARAVADLAAALGGDAT